VNPVNPIQVRPMRAHIENNAGEGSQPSPPVLDIRRAEAQRCLRNVKAGMRETAGTLADPRLHEDEVQAVIDAADALIHALDCVHDALFLRRDQS